MIVTLELYAGDMVDNDALNEAPPLPPGVVPFNNNEPVIFTDPVICTLPLIVKLPTKFHDPVIAVLPDIMVFFKLAISYNAAPFNVNDPDIANEPVL